MPARIALKAFRIHALSEPVPTLCHSKKARGMGGKSGLIVVGIPHFTRKYYPGRCKKKPDQNKGAVYDSFLRISITDYLFRANISFLNINE